MSKHTLHLDDEAEEIHIPPRPTPRFLGLEEAYDRVSRDADPGRVAPCRAYEFDGDYIGAANAVPEPSAFEKQVGGGHYKDMAIQPLDYILLNNLPYCEANVVKYVSRWRHKNGVEDLRKAIHYLEMLIEREGNRPTSGPKQF